MNDPLLGVEKTWDVDGTGVGVESLESELGSLGLGRGAGLEAVTLLTEDGLILGVVAGGYDVPPQLTVRGEDGWPGAEGSVPRDLVLDAIDMVRDIVGVGITLDTNDGEGLVRVVETRASLARSGIVPTCDGVGVPRGEDLVGALMREMTEMGVSVELE